MYSCLHVIFSGVLIALNKPFMRVFPFGTHFTLEYTEAMQINCLAQGCNILMQPVFELSIAVSRSTYLTHMNNTLTTSLYLFAVQLNIKNYTYLN